MKIRGFKASDYEELVDMYYNFTVEVYPDRFISEKYFFHRVVQKWIQEGADIVVSYNQDGLTGFSMCYKDDCGFITEPVYKCEVCFVKPEYRKTRAAYLLYNNGYSYAKEQGLIVSCNSRIENGVADMVEKHFNLKPSFILLEGRSHG